jgi:glycosyltransferase involved in cell wall biosynthesis
MSDSNASTPRTVLLVAYHYPPIVGSSGLQRTLRFSQHLPKFGWRPIVLSISPHAYEKRSESKGNEIPDGVEVHRAVGFDTARQLSLGGRYPRFLALPDRWATWRFHGIHTALRLIREKRIAALWSTFPIATAHTIGLGAARRSGLPWVAEFRDPLWQGSYPPDPTVNRAWKELERDIFGTASGVVVTTPGAAALYRDRFPHFEPSRIVTIENGYDEETFRRAEARLDTQRAADRGTGGPLTLLHSGVIYRNERDPSQLFAAVASLKQRGALGAKDLRILLRASGDEAGYRRQVDSHGIADVVKVEPAIDYLGALEEMLTVDGLLLLQAANCNAQVPAKLFEYLRAGRPILALTDPCGDTARTLDAAGAGVIARLDSQEEIERALLRFLTESKTSRWRRAGADAVARYSREAQAGQFARLLDEVSAARTAAGAAGGR